MDDHPATDSSEPTKRARCRHGYVTLTSAGIAVGPDERTASVHRDGEGKTLSVEFSTCLVATIGGAHPAGVSAGAAN
ncbi:hypothetical protein [Halobellus captivus]|uniref:hypothetical protein n=1 Tax=Halobellus captivus TaxID=2592614 RepID=UPI0011A68681|nr:hypothetical protein [Halobellus captivus]